MGNGFLILARVLRYVGMKIYAHEYEDMFRAWRALQEREPIYVRYFHSRTGSYRTKPNVRVRGHINNESSVGAVQKYEIP